MNDQNTSSNGSSLFGRRQLIQLLEAAIKEGELRFARSAADAWLASYPGDLEIQLYLALALMREKKLVRSIAIIERICLLDPEFPAAYRLLYQAASYSDYAGTDLVLGNLAALGVRRDTAVQAPAWGTALHDAGNLLAEGKEREAETLIQSALLAADRSPLPAVMHVKLARGLYEWKALKELLELYRDRWPETILFKLAEAEVLMQRGQDQDALALMHECVAVDTAGQVAGRFWGKDHSFSALWPDFEAIMLDIPIPVAVAKQLGLNRLVVADSKTVDLDPQETAPTGALELEHESPEPKKKRPWSKKKKSEAEALLDIKEELNRVAGRLRQPHFGRADGRFPVYVVLSTKHGLVKQYGEEGLPQVEQVIEQLVQTTRELPNWNALAVYADDQDGSSRLGLTPARPNDPWAIKNYLVDLDKALGRHGQMIGALLIVGGPAVVPFHLLPNPVDDMDAEVPSDNPYATLDEDYFIPSWPVGRIPGSAGKDPASLLSSLGKVVKARQESVRRQSFRFRLLTAFRRIFRLRRPLKTNFGYTAQIWQRASHSVFRIIGERRALAVSPPSVSEKLPRRARKPMDLAYYNLHGLADGPEWYGQRDPLETRSGPDYPIALRPDDVVNSGRAPHIVFTEACYGGHVAGKTIDSALALKFLASGTKAVVGSTTTSYGSISTPLIAADLLGQAFWKLLKEGHTAGEALRRAKIYLAREMHRRQGYLDGEDQKTLIQFVLYGDPLAQPQDQVPQLGNYQRFTNPHVKTVCDKTNGKLVRQPEVPEQVLKQVKGLVRDYLPGMAQARIHYAQEHVACIGHHCPNQQMSAKAHPKHIPGRRVVTLSKQVSSGSRQHPHYARVTFDRDGKMVKLAVSR